jgi:DNA-binding transcriptional regulator YdaS (Cro superfamily)
MHLKDYLKAERLSQEAFGAQVNPPVHQTLVSQWINGETAVTLHYSFQIFKATKENVTPKECLDMYIKKEVAT